MLVLYLLVVQYIVFIIVIIKREIEKMTKKLIGMEEKKVESCGGVLSDSYAKVFS